MRNWQAGRSSAADCVKDDQEIFDGIFRAAKLHLAENFLRDACYSVRKHDDVDCDGTAESYTETGKRS